MIYLKPIYGAIVTISIYVCSVISDLVIDRSYYLSEKLWLLLMIIFLLPTLETFIFNYKGIIKISKYPEFIIASLFFALRPTVICLFLIISKFCDLTTTQQFDFVFDFEWYNKTIAFFLFLILWIIVYIRMLFEKKENTGDGSMCSDEK